MTNVKQDSVLLRLAFHRVGNERKASMQTVQTDADKKRLKMTKKLFQCAEYRAISTFDNQIKQWVNSRAIAAQIGYKGISLLPLALLPEVERHLEEASIERKELVVRFLEVYNEERVEAREKLKEFFRESDYPDIPEVEDAFGMEWWYVVFEVPKNLPEELQEREREKLQERFNDMENQIQSALRQSFFELTKRLTDSLKPGPNGKKRRFHSSGITNLMDFLELFSARNVTDDVELEELAKQARQVVIDADPDEIRKNPDLRKDLEKSMTEVTQAAVALIGEDQLRKFNFDEEEDEGGSDAKATGLPF